MHNLATATLEQRLILTPLLLANVDGDFEMLCALAVLTRLWFMSGARPSVLTGRSPPPEHQQSQQQVSPWCGCFLSVREHERTRMPLTVVIELLRWRPTSRPCLEADRCYCRAPPPLHRLASPCEDFDHPFSTLSGGGPPPLEQLIDACHERVVST